ncbi:MAG: UDP-N-acetylmuramate--L-alanine ligase, partial [Acidobacteria bacterium]
ARGVPVIPRAEMLGELMRMKFAVAVAGSHGKTSTTSMIGEVLTAAGLDPTIVVGGRLASLGSGARHGASDLLVAEADESDGSFLRLFPTIAVVTGIDREHLAHYGDLAQLHEAFRRFVARVPFWGAAVVCLDDPGVRELLPRLDRRVIPYGFAEGARVRGLDVVQEGFATRFVAEIDGRRLEVHLPVPGRHQVQNALATLAVATELEVPAGQAAEALAGYRGPDRRMQRLGEFAGVLVVDDYGHHPREIEVTLGALRRAIGARRLVVLFEPHRYSRLDDLFDRFAHAFGDADAVRITDVYAAGEPPIPGRTGEALAARIAAAGHPDARYVGPLDEAERALAAELRAGDVLLTLGAGRVGRSAHRLAERLGDAA